MSHHLILLVVLQDLTLEDLHLATTVRSSKEALPVPLIIETSMGLSMRNVFLMSCGFQPSCRKLMSRNSKTANILQKNIERRGSFRFEISNYNVLSV